MNCLNNFDFRIPDRDGFTRDNGVRNKLGLIVPKEWLGSVVISGLDEQLSIFFRQIKINENIHLNNVIDLSI